jgi:hypothetical protein
VKDFCIKKHTMGFQVRRRDGAVVAEVATIEEVQAIATAEQRRLDVRVSLRSRAGMSGAGRRARRQPAQ